MTLDHSTDALTGTSGDEDCDGRLTPERLPANRPVLRLVASRPVDTSPATGNGDSGDSSSVGSAASRLFGARTAARTSHPDGQLFRKGRSAGEPARRHATGRRVAGRNGTLPGPVDLGLVDRLRRELEAHALSEETRRSYRHHQAAWREWCEEHEIDPDQATADHVAQHLVAYLIIGAENGEVQRDDNDELLAAVTVASIQQRLAAIDRWYSDAGQPRPGHSRAVKTLLEGVRRLYGVAPIYAKQPIVLEQLRTIVRWIRADDQLIPLRDLVIAHLRRTARATPGQLARLTWSDVEIGEVDAYIQLPPDRRGGPRRRVRVRASRNPDTCPVATLRRLQAWLKPDGGDGTGGAVLTAPDGSRLTRQGIDKHLRRRSTETGNGALDMTPPVPSTKVLRDVALLTCGWFAALRRSNLTALRWSDLSWDSEGNVRLRLRRTKTDQHGRGSFNWLPLLEGDPVCPAAAISAWRNRMTELLGADPLEACPESRVFPAMKPHDQLSITPKGDLRRLRGEAINELVQELAISSGLTKAPQKGERNPYGGHSLRSGFVTQSVRAGVPLLDITKVTHHADPRGVVSYNKPEERGQLRTLRAVVEAA